MVTSTTAKGTTTSFSKTPQAHDDTYSLREDGILEGSYAGVVYNADTRILTLDVMSNDLGGAAKTLFSIDDGNGNTNLTDYDLLSADAAGVWESSADGNKVRIFQGKIDIDISAYLNSHGGSLNALGADDHLHDEFVYAIRLGNGTLSQAKVTIDISGSNDLAHILSGPQSGTVVEDAVSAAGGTIGFADADYGDTHTATFVANPGNTTSLGTFSLDAVSESHGLSSGTTGSQAWHYALDNAAAQHLAQGESVTEHYTVTINDGHGSVVSQDVAITIQGTNDGPVAMADTNSGLVSTLITGTVATNDSDVDDGAVLTYSLNSPVAGLTIHADGSYSLDAGNAAYLHLHAVTDVVASYTVTDEHGATDTQTLTITVDPGIVAPTLSVTISGTTTSTDYSVGAQPYDIAVADLNGDGKADLVVANFFSDSVSVLLGNGDGSFGAATEFAAGYLSNSTLIGDLNGDGKLDIAIADYSGTFAVLLGNGDGTFAGTNFTTEGRSLSGTIGDFNGDGKLDLAFAKPDLNAVSVMLGNGNGSFGAATTFAVGANPNYVGTGDFNGDGKLDLVSASADTNTLSVLLGNGSGGFAAATNVATGIGPFEVAIGDFNGDGKSDFAVVNNGSADVSVLLGNGDGSFATAANFLAGSNPISITTVDFNGDGKTDLAIAFSSSHFGVMLGDGAGGFGASTDFAAGTNPRSIATGDFNGDGKPDLAVTNQGSNTVTVLVPASATEGSTLTATATATQSSSGPMTISYQWQHSFDGGTTWSDIAGATSSTYTLTEGDENGQVRVHASATDDTGQTVTADSNASDIVHDVAPVVVDDTVTMTAPEWAVAGSIDLGTGTDTLNVVAQGDISALGTPVVLNVEIGNLIGTGGNDTLTLTGSQLDHIVIGPGTIDLGTGTDTINLTSTSLALNGLGQTDASVSRVEAISGASALAGVQIDMSGQSEAFTLTGSAFGDTLRGGAGADTLIGGAGDDMLNGGAGADVLNGGAGNDAASYIGSAAGLTVSLGNTALNTGEAAGDIYIGIEGLSGSTFADVLAGDAGSNVLQGNGGADALDGQAGFDYASYSLSTTGVTVSFTDPSINTGEAIGDTYVSMEGLIGSSFDDVLIGDAGVNLLRGNGGADVLNGMGGNDDVSYIQATAGVTASFTDPSINTGDAAGDTYISIEGLAGSFFDDILIGDAGNNWLRGYSGADVLDGKGGFDTAGYQNFGAVTASLTDSSVNTGDAAGDIYIGIEALAGSAFDDVLIGDAGNNVLYGNGGADVLDGRAGIDTAFYFFATSGVTASLADPSVNTGEAAGDTYISIEQLQGSNFGDMLIGDAGGNFLNGLGGNDTLDGGAGGDNLTGGAGNDTFVFTRGEVTSFDNVFDFNGNGAAAGDQFRFQGYGTAADGASFTMVNATHWSINSADGLTHDVISLSNAPTVDLLDYYFI